MLTYISNYELSIPTYQGFSVYNFLAKDLENITVLEVHCILVGFHDTEL